MLYKHIQKHPDKTILESPYCEKDFGMVIITTTEDVKKVSNMLNQGFGYKKIASLTGLPVNTVKTFYHRHKNSFDPSADPRPICRFCGKPLALTPKHRPKKYCSEQCRMQFWGSHREEINHRVVYTFVCPFCGKQFTSNGNPHRKYCSRTCAACARKKG